MNQARYDSLPADLKRVIDANSGVAPSRAFGKMGRLRAAGPQARRHDRGNTFYVVPASELANWEKATSKPRRRVGQGRDREGNDGKMLLQTSARSHQEYEAARWGAPSHGSRAANGRDSRPRQTTSGPTGGRSSGSPSFAYIGGAIFVAIAVLGSFDRRAGDLERADPGDYELVQLGGAVFVSLTLPLCQMRRGNIIVDFFTVRAGRRPARARRRRAAPRPGDGAAGLADRRGHARHPRGRWDDGDPRLADLDPLRGVFPGVPLRRRRFLSRRSSTCARPAVERLAIGGLLGFAAMIALMVDARADRGGDVRPRRHRLRRALRLSPLLAHLKGALWARFSVYDLSVIPLFILMGQFATQGGLSRALFRAASAFVGHLRGPRDGRGPRLRAAFGAICGRRSRPPPRSPGRPAGDEGVRATRVACRRRRWPPAGRWAS